MLKEEVMESISLKKRFCKDYSIPMTIFDNPYFYQRLCAIDAIRPCIDNFERFCKELRYFRNEQDYFEYYNSVKDNAINYIKNRLEFNCFKQVKFDNNYCCSKRNLYIEENNGKIFASIDMKKANFSALYHWSPEIFNFKESWEDFLAQFTNSLHILKSKYIRQVIMGACNPEKQLKYEHYLMNKVAKIFMSQCPTLNIFSLGEDEILIEFTGDKSNSNEINNWKKLISSIVAQSEIKDIVRTTVFKLEKIPKTDGWVKFIYDDNNYEVDIEFKCLNAEIYHQVVKHFIVEPITDDDLVFYHNGQLAKFLKPIDNPWEEKGTI